MNMSVFFMLKSSIYAIISSTLKYIEKEEDINKRSYLSLSLVIYLIIIIFEKSHCISYSFFVLVKFSNFLQNEIYFLKMKIDSSKNSYI